MAQATAESAPKPIEANRLEALAEYLRDHAGESHDSSALARQFGFDEQFVADVVGMLSTTEAPTVIPTLTDYWIQVSSSVRKVSRKISAVFRSWTADPIKFVLYTGGFCMITLWAWSISQFTNKTPVGIENTAIPLLFLLTFPLHLLCFVRHGRLRFPLYSAAVLALALIPAVAPIFVDALKDNNGQRWVAMAFAGAFDFAISGTYAFLGCVAALLGGFFQVQRDERRDRRLGRQELLERLFRMQARLAQVSAEPQGLTRRVSLKQKIRWSPFLPPLAFILGAVSSFILHLMIAGATSGIQDPKVIEDVRVGITTLANFVGSLALMVLGYIGGRPLRSIMIVFLALGGSLLVSNMPSFQEGRGLDPISLSQIAVVLAIGFLSGAGGLVEDKTFNKRRLREDDPAFLLAEMVRIQRRLKRGRRAACVLMVDVARSTAMKADSDQFDVEYSFRRYHQLVESISGRHRGDVVSTAGDGAVVVFEHAGDALNAAKEMQGEISRFNADLNRLRLPFGLRIGIHCGETESELHQAPYNELIDVAAHVQAMSPVGGIALTDTTKELLEGERLAEITEIVDGHKVHISLDPVLVG